MNAVSEGGDGEFLNITSCGSPGYKVFAGFEHISIAMANEASMVIEC
jgi:hypothetical protein